MIFFRTPLNSKISLFLWYTLLCSKKQQISYDEISCELLQVCLLVLFFYFHAVIAVPFTFSRAILLRKAVHMEPFLLAERMLTSYHLAKWASIAIAIFHISSIIKELLFLYWKLHLYCFFLLFRWILSLIFWRPFFYFLPQFSSDLFIVLNDSLC